MDVKLVYVAPDYLSYLRFCGHNLYGRPGVLGRHPHLFLLLSTKFNGHCYCIPISSPKDSDYTVENGTKKIKESTVGIYRVSLPDSTGKPDLKCSLRLSHMFPVPEHCITYYDSDKEQDKKYDRLVQKEVSVLQNQMAHLEHRAHVAYVQKTERVYIEELGYYQNTKPYLKLFLDFNKMEDACTNYALGLTGVCEAGPNDFGLRPDDNPKSEWTKLHEHLNLTAPAHQTHHHHHHHHKKPRNPWDLGQSWQGKTGWDKPCRLGDSIDGLKRSDYSLWGGDVEQQQLGATGYSPWGDGQQGAPADYSLWGSDVEQQQLGATGYSPWGEGQQGTPTDYSLWGGDAGLGASFSGLSITEPDAGGRHGAIGEPLQARGGHGAVGEPLQARGGYGAIGEGLGGMSDGSVRRKMHDNRHRGGECGSKFSYHYPQR